MRGWEFIRKQGIVIGICAMFVCLLFCCTSYAEELSDRETAQPPKDIHIVWDTSGSMVAPEDEHGVLKPIDIWAKAYYALEAFTAIVEAEDNVSLYPMSMDVEKIPIETPFLIEGQSSQDRVDSVRKAPSSFPITLHTYFRTVERASQKDWREGYQRWLVIITDGVFNRSYGMRENGVPEKGDYPKDKESLLESLIAFLNEDPSLHIIYLNIGKEGKNGLPVGLAGKMANGAVDGRLYWLPEKSDMSITDMMMEVSQILSNLDTTPKPVLGDNGKGKVTLPFPAKKLVMFIQRNSGGLGNDTAKIPFIDKAENDWNSEVTFFQAPCKTDGPDIQTYARDYPSDKAENLTLTKEDLKTIDNSGAVVIYSPKSPERNIANGEYSFTYQKGDVYSFFYVPDVAVTVELRQGDATFTQSTLQSETSTPQENVIKTGLYDLEVVLKDPQTGKSLTDTGGNFADKDFSITITDRNGTRSYNQKTVTESLIPGETVIVGRCPMGSSGQEKWAVKIPVRVECEDGQTIFLEDMENEAALPKIFLIPEEEGELHLEDFTCKLAWGAETANTAETSNATETAKTAETTKTAETANPPETASTPKPSTPPTTATPPPLNEDLKNSLTWVPEPTKDGDGWFFRLSGAKENLRRVANGNYRLQFAIDTGDSDLWIEDPRQEITVSLLHKPQTLAVVLEQPETISAWSLYWKKTWSLNDRFSPSDLKVCDLTYLLGSDPLSAASDREWLTGGEEENAFQRFLTIDEGNPFQLLVNPGRRWWKYQGEPLRLGVWAEYDSGGTKSRTTPGAYVELLVEPLTTRQRCMIVAIWFFLAALVALLVGFILAWFFGVVILKRWVPMSLCIYRKMGRSEREKRCKRAEKGGGIRFKREVSFCLLDKNVNDGREEEWRFPDITLRRLKGGDYQIENYKDFRRDQYRLNGDPITESNRIMKIDSVLEACDKGPSGNCDWSKEGDIWRYRLGKYFERQGRKSE